MVGLVLAACAPQEKKTDIRLTFEHLGNTDGNFKAKFTLINNSTYDLTSDNWKLYYNQSPRNLNQDALEGPVNLAMRNGDFYELTPTPDFSLPSGKSIEIVYAGYGPLIKHVDAPVGPYFVLGDNEEIYEPSYEVVPFDSPDKINRSEGDVWPLATAANYFDTQQAWFPAPASRLVPTPVSESFDGRRVELTSSWTIGYAEGLDKEAEFLSTSLQGLLGTTPSISQGSGSIQLGIDSRIQAEGYRLEITERGITLDGGDAHGVFYGIQSVLALAPVANYKSPSDALELPVGRIEDYPRFGYRGMHMDAARNFQSMSAVFKLIDHMAFYKLNKLHLHLTDDEGWRLQINSLPELTEVGAVRNHTLDEKGTLRPGYGSGPAGGLVGSGFYSQDDYIQIVRYANDRHIEVIPEINFPGHARAAIVAMNARYERLMAEGDEAGALEYFLIDDADQSEYSSAQFYNDNIVCVCNEGVYRLFETVVDELVGMHERAGVPLKTVHTGGDEVPRGSWEKSPDCEQFLAMNDAYSYAKSLQTYFQVRANRILASKNLVTAGWEEVAMDIKEDGTWEPNLYFVGKDVVPYVWNNLWGNQDLGYRLANAGFPVVLCNVTNLYFDLAYDKDPREPGLYWGGFIDTRSPWSFVPEDIYKSTKQDPYGNTFDPATDFEGMERLTGKGLENIIGIQAELWSETIKGDDMLEYYYLPKIMGLAERAWSPRPAWSRIEDHTLREIEEDKAWNEFASRIGTRDLPRLNYIFGGSTYRIAPPGGKLEGGKLVVNQKYPGFVTRFTTDGSEPTSASALYEGPVAVSGDIVIKNFDREGNESLSFRLD